MAYYYQKIVENAGFDEVVARCRLSLKDAGFGVITEIDFKKTMKDKLDADIQPYLVLGACNPGFAYKALQLENKIGTLLPCNVIVQELEPGRVEVAAINPVVAMEGIGNKDLLHLAAEVGQRLQTALKVL